MAIFKFLRELAFCLSKHTNLNGVIRHMRLTPCRYKTEVSIRILKYFFYTFVCIYRHKLYQIEEQLLNKFKALGMF